VTAAGLPVELEVTGQRRPVSPGVDISGFRIVQEALTKALRHAGPARARVVVDYQADHIEIDVSDDGRGGRPGADSRGHGVTGMRERAAVFGGSLDAGPRPQGGFRVRTRLPLEASPS
jgi:signal transduction histidine kinase